MMVVAVGSAVGQAASAAAGQDPSGPTPVPNRSKAPSASVGPAGEGTTTVTGLMRDAAPATARVTNDNSDSDSFQDRLRKRLILSVVTSLMAQRRGEGSPHVVADKRPRFGPEAHDLFPENGDRIVQDDVLMLQAIRQFVAAVRQRVNGSDHVSDDLSIDAAGPVRHATDHAYGPLPGRRFRRWDNPDDPFTMELGDLRTVAKRRKWIADIGWPFEHARRGIVGMRARRKVVAQFLENLAYH